MAEFISNYAISTLASAGATFDPTVNLGPGRRTMADLYPKSAIAKLCSRVTTMTNFADRTIWTGVNLDILRGLNSASVDLIYSDPPFNSNRNYAAPVESAAAGAAFKDTWTLPDPDVAWMRLIADQQPAMYQVLQAAGLNHGKGTHSYLCMMAVRLLEMRRSQGHRIHPPSLTDAPVPYRQNKHVLFGQQEGRCNGCRSESFPSASSR